MPPKKIAKIFRALLRPQKISAPPFAMKIKAHPIKKHVNSIFTGKFQGNFFKAPLQGLTNFKGPLFTISHPPTSVCERSPISK